MRLDLETVTLEVEDHGEGVPVILLHGFPLSSEIWNPIRPALEQAARLITPDLRGFGGSDKPEGDYGVETLAGDVLRLADRLGLERFVLGGHSMGGYVALRVAAGHAGRLAGLVLVSSRAAGDPPAASAGRDAGIARIRRGEVAGFLDDLVPNALGPSTRRRAPRLVSDLRAIAGAVPEHVLVGCLAGMRDRPDSSGILPQLEVPALVVAGQEDPVVPVDEAQAMAAAPPRATLALIPEAGHIPSVERPIPTADAMLAFLREHFASRPSTIGRRQARPHTG